MTLPVPLGKMVQQVCVNESFLLWLLPLPSLPAELVEAVIFNMILEVPSLLEEDERLLKSAYEVAPSLPHKV